MKIEESIKFLKDRYNNIEYNQERMKICEEEIDQSKFAIADLINNDTEFREYLIRKLEEGIEKFDQNKDREDNEYNDSTCTYSSIGDDGNITTGSTTQHIKNPKSKFIPSKDDWTFSRYTENKDGDIMIYVENIKGAKTFNAYMWTPDEYHTDWISLK